MGRIDNEFSQQIAALTQQKDMAYAERNLLLSLVAKMAISLGLPAGLGKHDPKDKTWEDDWRNIVFIDLPEGQCSWHIHDSEMPLFDFLPLYEGSWDGHSTEEKYERVKRSTFEYQRRKSGKGG